MWPYEKYLKEPSRRLRRDLTDCERLVWSRLRRKQVQGVQFYRQKPLYKYIVDFYAPRAKLVIEIDGSQHFEKKQLEQDKERDYLLSRFGINVLRFTNMEIVMNIDGVMEVIHRIVNECLGANPS